MELFELGWPGPMRDGLVAAVLAGEKTATSSLRELYDLEGGQLPQPGEQTVLVGSAGEHLAIVETTMVDVLRLAEVDDQIALAEGEGFVDAAAWRAAHESFWSEELASTPGAENIVLDDKTPVVVETFRVVRLLD